MSEEKVIKTNETKDVVKKETTKKPKKKVVKNLMVEEHKKLCIGLNKLYEKKNAAYGDSFGKSFADYGVTSALVRMSDKWNRLNELAMNKDVDNLGESLEDTLIDMSNYCLMTVMELRKQKKENK